MSRAIGMRVRRAEITDDPGVSKFFGDPTVPNAWCDNWPDDVIFFCQLRLDDIAALDKEDRLPHKGYLYIFLDGKITHFIGFGLFVVNLLVLTTYLLNKLIQNRIISSSDNSLGVIAMVVNVIMYSSPITNIIKLCKFRYRKFLPIYTNIIGLLTTSVYILYGVLTENKPTWISNVASLGIIIIQICIWGYIYWRYPNNAPKVERIDIVENDRIVHDEESKPESNNLDYDSD